MRVACTFCLLMATVLVLLAACGASTVRQTPLPSETPVVFTFYGTGGGGGLKALHANNGLPMWKRQVGNLNLPPVMASGVIYGLADEHPPSRPTVIAVRASDGKVLWRTPMPNWDSFAYVAADSSIVALMTGSGGLFGLDPATGEQRWHIAGTGEVSLLVHHGVVYATLAISAPPGSPSGLGSHLTPPPLPTSTPPGPGGTSLPPGYTYLMAVRSHDGARLWQTPFDLNARPLVANDHAIYGAATGVDVHTRQVLTPFSPDAVGEPGVTGTVNGWVVAASEQVVLISDNKPRAQHMKALSAVDGHVLWEVPFAFGPSASESNGVQIVGDSIYNVDGNGQITAVRVSDGSALWHVRFANQNPGSLSVTGGVVFATLYPYHEGELLIPDIRPCIVGCATSIVSLDATTGGSYWQRDEPAAQVIVATDQP